MYKIDRNLEYKGRGGRERNVRENERSHDQHDRKEELRDRKEK